MALTRVAASGTSQDDGIALAAASLSDGLVAVMPSVPFSAISNELTGPHPVIDAEDISMVNMPLG